MTFMSFGNDKKINQNLPVVIDKQLARGRYEMSTDERRLMYVAMSKIKPVDGKFHTVSFTKKDYIELLNDVGVSIDTGTFDERLKQSCRALLQRLVEVIEGRKWKAWQWMSKAEYDADTTIVQLRFHDEMEPYLLFLKERFGYSKFLLRYALPLTSHYAVRFYERFRGQISKDMPARKEKMTLEEIREFLMLDGKYLRYPDLKKAVIEQARKEINQKTDIIMSYRETRRKSGRGRPVESLTFLVELKPTEAPPDEKSYLAWDIDDLIDQIVTIIEQADQRRIKLNKWMLPNSEYAHHALAMLLAELKRGEHAFWKIRDLQSWLEKTLAKYANELHVKQISFDQLEAERKKTLDMAKEVFSSNDE